jgi:hypothetical protein
VKLRGFFYAMFPAFAVEHKIIDSGNRPQAVENMEFNRKEIFL